MISSLFCFVLTQIYQRFLSSQYQKYSYVEIGQVTVFADKEFSEQKCNPFFNEIFV